MVDSKVISIEEYNRMSKVIKCKLKTKKIKFCNYCSFPSTKVIKCTRCKKEFCLNCLTMIEQDNSKVFCHECLSKFIKEEKPFIITF